MKTRQTKRKVKTKIKWKTFQTFSALFTDEKKFEQKKNTMPYVSNK